MADDAGGPVGAGVAKTYIVNRIHEMRERHLPFHVISAELNLSVGKMQRMLRVGEPIARRERDPDFSQLAAALKAGSTLRAEWSRYASRCPKPYSFSQFATRLRAWTDGGFATLQSDGRKQIGGNRLALTSRRTELLPTAIDGSDAEKIIQRMLNTVPKGRRFATTQHQPISAATSDFTPSNPLEKGLLWVSEPGTALQIRKDALTVRYRDGAERYFPRGKHGLKTVILNSPGASITIEAMRFVIDENVLLMVMHRAGEALALLTEHPTINSKTRALELRQAQFTTSVAHRAAIAKEIVIAKIKSAQYAGVLTSEEATMALRQAALCKTSDEAILCEGAMARIYWRRFSGFELPLRGNAPAAWKFFDGRREKRGSQFFVREARTPLNACLNYSYGITLGNVTRALIGLGFDPCFGFLHAERSGRLSLSYDTIEVVRPKVDICVFQWAASRIFERTDFVEMPGGQVLLTQRVARDLAKRVLERIPPAECEGVARWLAGVVSRKGPAGADPGRRSVVKRR